MKNSRRARAVLAAKMERRVRLATLPEDKRSKFAAKQKKGVDDSTQSARLASHSTERQGEEAQHTMK